MYVSVSKVPKVRLGFDTVFIRIWIPYETADIRIPDDKINLRYRKPAKLHAGLSAPPLRRQDEIDGKRIHPILEGYVKIIPLKGKMLNAGDVAFDFEAGTDAWEIEYGILPIKSFNGVYVYYVSVTQYKDRCVQIDPTTILVNTPTNHYLVKERFDFPFSAHANDVLFYVE